MMESVKRLAFSFKQTVNKGYYLLIASFNSSTINLNLFN